MYRSDQNHRQLRKLIEEQVEAFENEFAKDVKNISRSERVSNEDVNHKINERGSDMDDNQR